MNCSHCNKPIVEAVSASVWYMHDNHTFTRLRGDVDAIVAEAARLSVESPGGMLSCVRVLDAEERELRAVAINVHGRYGSRGFSTEDLAEWRRAVLADPDATRLLTVAAVSCKTADSSEGAP